MLAETIAREMKDALDRSVQVAPFTSRWPALSLADAYEIADRVRGMRSNEGARVVGRKIGFTNSRLWPIYDVREPIWGYVYDTTLMRTDTPRAKLSLAGLADPRIEPEIIFGMKEGLRKEVSVADAAAAIEWIACGFEIVQSHFPEWKFKVADTVIDGGLHGKLVVGPPVALRALGSEPAAALESFTIALSRDGQFVEEGCGSSVLGSPLKAMTHLAAILADRDEGAALKPGEVVTTGTLTLAYPIRVGETWNFTVKGLPLPGMTLELLG